MSTVRHVSSLVLQGLSIVLSVLGKGITKLSELTAKAADKVKPSTSV